VSPLPYIGYRIWRADENDLTLASLSDDTPWPIQAEMEANSPPSRGRSGLGGYGFHAMYDFFHGDTLQVRLEHSFELWYSMERIARKIEKRPGIHWVAGAIVAWGEIALHEFGFRAEHCRIVALHYQPQRPDFARARAYADFNPWLPPTRMRMIADRYGLPIADSPAKLASYAGEWGRHVGPEILAA
jgi:hypothetical protein